MGRFAPNKSGVHFLSSGRVAGRLVRAAGLRAGDLVVDVCAGTGALTGPLARIRAPALAVAGAPWPIGRAGVGGGAGRALWAGRRRGFAARGRRAADLLGWWLPGGRAHGVLVASGIDPPAPVRAINVTGWRRLATT